MAKDDLPSIGYVRGDGKLWFTNQKADQRIDYRMRFANFPEMEASIVLEPNEGGTLVKWSSEGVLPSGPFYGFFRHGFVSGMTRQYEQSLGKLKAVVEGPENPEPEPEPTGSMSQSRKAAAERTRR